MRGDCNTTLPCLQVRKTDGSVQLVPSASCAPTATVVQPDIQACQSIVHKIDQASPTPPPALCLSLSCAPPPPPRPRPRSSSSSSHGLVNAGLACLAAHRRSRPGICFLLQAPAFPPTPSPPHPPTPSPTYPASHPPSLQVLIPASAFPSGFPPAAGAAATAGAAASPSPAAGPSPMATSSAYATPGAYASGTASSGPPASTSGPASMAALPTTTYAAKGRRL